MGLVFALLALLWGLLTVMLRLDAAPADRGPDLPSSTADAREDEAGSDATSAGVGVRRPRTDGMEADLVAAIMVAVLTHRADAPARSRAGDAQLLARQPALCVPLGCHGPCAPEPQLAAERKIMRRYTLDIGGREFSIDVQELTADRFQVVVGNETYDVDAGRRRGSARGDDHAGVFARAGGWRRHAFARGAGRGARACHDRRAETPQARRCRWRHA